MDVNEYQEKSRRTVRKGLSVLDKLTDGALGLSGESGEVADIIKKYRYQGHELNLAELKNELGDVLWYVSLVSDAINVPMEEIMKSNIEKLAKRYKKEFTEKESIYRK